MPPCRLQSPGGSGNVPPTGTTPDSAALPHDAQRCRRWGSNPRPPEPPYNALLTGWLHHGISPESPLNRLHHFSVLFGDIRSEHF